MVADAAFHLGEIQFLFLLINRMVRISLQHGLGDASGVAFALYGFSLTSKNGDRRENYRYGKLALLIQERTKAKEWDCRVLVYVYVLLNHWQEPLQKSLEPLLSARKHINVFVITKLICLSYFLPLAQHLFVRQIWYGTG